VRLIWNFALSKQFNEPWFITRANFWNRKILKFQFIRFMKLCNQKFKRHQRLNKGISIKIAILLHNSLKQNWSLRGFNNSSYLDTGWSGLILNYTLFKIIDFLFMAKLVSSGIYILICICRLLIILSDKE